MVLFSRASDARRSTFELCSLSLEDMSDRARDCHSAVLRPCNEKAQGTLNPSFTSVLCSLRLEVTSDTGYGRRDGSAALRELEEAFAVELEEEFQCAMNPS